ncbi:GWxTD domain-containing protein [Candidatus Kryptonium thompsonii]|uniref:GWxTD domain-containing protein n=3 Tax=Candidatus Kryptonium thompsonii TaxID=1633631 RepID=A0A0P1LZ45_9BACT|nr:GWxTD domain-containing protein [Candidatus Kryptonium thompsoni]CUS78465.1 GWxTD domain-containing protein [Candidatus Kryptonium thompsoni]CUS80061.1 GWxTD domain-containing protein [Candidatus Kryptonium thompsoni]CUS86493.1 GWxTD domain-containing protein [Candidatus Kryptonium thompsoni]CUS89215.1 GWxTD domain-containing protein [Candidatus Kryptonium thompsoni]CUS91512.1 GWxTD domain-containing protein [Candidatus Kryptonium thompsoni]
MLKVLVALLIASQLLGQNPLRINADYASFKYDASRNYVEIYYSFQHKQLKLVKDGNTFKGGLVIQVLLKRPQEDSIIQGKAWKIPIEIKDTSEIDPNKNLIGATAFLIEPGKYQFILIARDLNDFSRFDSLIIPALINPVPENKLWLSDVELCSNIYQSNNKESIFYKNTFEVIPNPSLIYGLGLPVLYYYAEIYNINTIDADKYVVEWRIYDSFGNVVKSGKKLRMKTAANAIVEAGTVNLSNLPSGTYRFVLTAIDTSKNKGVSSIKRFYIYNPNITPTDTFQIAKGYDLTSEYAGMSETELDKEFAMARYIATPEEINRYKQLKGEDAKRKFLADFWVKRDPDKSTPINEMKIEYFKRVEYANQHFSVGNKEGWKTDRGRVYIMYGPPDEYERHPSEVDSKPYEIWYYHNIEGGVEFVFVDKSGFSDYILVHSTKRNEIRDDNWRIHIAPN